MPKLTKAQLRAHDRRVARQHAYEVRLLAQLSAAIPANEAHAALWLAIMNQWPVSSFEGGYAQREALICDMLDFYAKDDP